MIGKSGQLGDGILMIYRLLLVSIVAFIILGIGAVYYDHYIEVKNVEARIMNRNIKECLSGNGIFNLDSFDEEDSSSLLPYCGFENVGAERFFVKVIVSDSSGVVAEFKQGDSGKLWVKDFYRKVNREGEDIYKYEPGYLKKDYPVWVLKDGSCSEGKLDVEVLVSYEE